MEKYRAFLKQKIEYCYQNRLNKITHIGYGIDNNFMRGTMTSIVSFCLNNQDRALNFHIVTYDLLEENKRRFETIAKSYNVNINIYIINTRYFKDLPVLENFNLPMSMYFRFALPMILKNINRLLYIDGDIICLKSIKNLFEVNLENNIIAAVSDQDGINNERNKVLNLKNHIYFNSGMLLIDVKKWNEINFFEKAKELLINNAKKYVLPDQDVLNKILINKVKYVDCIYNCFVDYRNCEKEINNKDIVLLHFSAMPKPWNVGWYISEACNDFNCNLYNYYEQKTPWKDIPLYEPRTYHEIYIYAKSLYNNHQYFEWIKWRLKWGLLRIKSIMKN